MDQPYLETHLDQSHHPNVQQQSQSQPQQPTPSQQHLLPQQPSLQSLISNFSSQQNLLHQDSNNNHQLSPHQQSVLPQQHLFNDRFQQQQQQQISGQQGVGLLPQYQLQQQRQPIPPHPTTSYFPIHSNYLPNNSQQTSYSLQNQYVLQPQPPQPLRQTSYETKYEDQQQQSSNSNNTTNSRDTQSSQNNRDILSYNNNANSANDKNLVAPIPPLHVQHQMFVKQEANNESDNQNQSNSTTNYLLSSNISNNENQQMVRSSCTRCNKEFDQPVIIPKVNDASGSSKSLTTPKIFKLCQHCRDLQRQRSRRWQKKTKDKLGVCRRCGSDIPIEERKFVLCPSCRQNLRTRKANRAAQGKCVHCSGPLDASILLKDEKGNIVTENLSGGNNPIHDENGNEILASRKTKGNANNYKVCQRCRENDKIRRTNLEKMGNCNRCTKALDPNDYGRHKVCSNCRSKKKKTTTTKSSRISSSPTSSSQHSPYQEQIQQQQHIAQHPITTSTIPQYGTTLPYGQQSYVPIVTQPYSSQPLPPPHLHQSSYQNLALHQPYIQQQQQHQDYYTQQHQHQ
ncbi:unnamed protein product [Candida verbasci]|uniref:White-opaque regulator 3 n=1 Tax=Candida verbasci TaxID=1227364 RepID=A0A9W4XBC0_9ASCO|nr:unnamed protein product [Candida verbasci]